MNFFDPALAQSVMSRYADTRNETETSGQLAQAGQRLMQTRQAQDQAAWEQKRRLRDELLQDRADKEYEEKNL